METKTITLLKSKPWYRAIKILNGFYVFMCYLTAIYSIIGIGMLLYHTPYYDTLFYRILIPTTFMFFYISLAMGLTCVISKVPKWIFYYIYFGSIKPER